MAVYSTSVYMCFNITKWS